ncbi:MAG: hypothetical protein AAF456_24970 [Planctomycetota bacterium]
MIRIKTLLLGTTLACLFSLPVCGQVVCFDFTGGTTSPHHTDLDEVLSGSTTLGTTTMTVTAIASVGIPELNFDATDGIGVNITDNTADENDKLDAAVADESIEFSFNEPVTVCDLYFDGLGWGSSTDYEYADVLVNGSYLATLLDTDTDATTAAQHANPIISAPSDEFTGLTISLAIGDVLTIEYFEVGANNGFRIEKIGVEPATSGVITVAPSSFTRTRGDLVSGSEIELAESDNVDLSLQRRGVDIQSITQFEVKGTSPFAVPSDIEVTLEGSVFARSTVNQTIEAFNYNAQTWDQIDVRAAVRLTDSVVTVPIGQAASDYVEPGTNCIELRITYQSLNQRQRFSSNTDQLIWTITQ